MVKLGLRGLGLGQGLDNNFQSKIQKLVIVWMKIKFMDLFLR